MVDAYVQMRQGEKGPVFGTVAVSTGTVTVSGTPTCTLKDSTLTPVTGLSAINVTGSDAGALTAVRAWLDLDTLTPAVLAVGFYTLVFSIACTGSDGLARNSEPNIQIQILPATG